MIYFSQHHKLLLQGALRTRLREIVALLTTCATPLTELREIMSHFIVVMVVIDCFCSAALSNNKTFPSRSGPHESKTKYFEVFVRRLFRIFSHVWAQLLCRCATDSHSCRLIFITPRTSHDLKMPHRFTSDLRCSHSLSI